MTVLIREAEGRDVDWMADTGHAWDSVLGRDFWVRLVTGAVEPVVMCLVAESDVDRVGFAVLSAPPSLPVPLLVIVVAVDQRGSGIGSQLLAAVFERYPSGSIGGNLPDDDPRSLAIVEHWGAEVIGHGIDSVLILAGRPGVPPLADDRRIEYVPLRDAGPEFDDLIRQAGDYPEGELYGARLTNAALVGFAPDMVWAAIREGSTLVAATAITPLGEDEWYVHFTACAPAYRGQGLARAAKEAAHALAQSRGAVRVRTTNEDRNERMRGLNASLGYEPERGDYRVALRRD